MLKSLVPRPALLIHFLKNRFVHSAVLPGVHHPSIFAPSNDMAPPPQPELPHPAHLDRDSALGRKFGKEITNYFGGKQQVCHGVSRASN